MLIRKNNSSYRVQAGSILYKVLVDQTFVPSNYELGVRALMQHGTDACAEVLALNLEGQEIVKNYPMISPINYTKKGE